MQKDKALNTFWFNELFYKENLLFFFFFFFFA